MTTRPRRDHLPPANESAERAILGAVLLDNSLYAAAGGLDADDFFLKAHKIIYLRIGEMLERGEAVDPVTLIESLRTTKDLIEVGSMPVAYINNLNSETIRYQPAVKDWARIVKAKSLLRQLMGSCSSAIEKAYAGESGFDIIAALRDQLEEIEIAARNGVRVKPAPPPETP